MLLLRIRNRLQMTVLNVVNRNIYFKTEVELNNTNHYCTIFKEKCFVVRSMKRNSRGLNTSRSKLKVQHNFFKKIQ